MSARRSPDFVLFTLTVVLLVIGVLMVFDASYARAGESGDSYFYLKRQAIFALIGLGALFGGMAIPYRWLKLRPVPSVLLPLAIVALALVFVPGLGQSAGGATRWIKCPVFGRFQPSELAKLCLAVYMAWYLATIGRDIRDFKRGFFWALIPLGFIGVLVMAEPDMGTTVVLSAMTLTMIFLAGARWRHLALVLAIGIALGTVLIMIEPYRKERLLSFINPWKYYYGSGYQVCRSLTGLGAGGLTGTGFCESREKLFFLPAVYTDFIYAVLGEEVGFVGALFVAGLFLLFGARGLAVAHRTKDPFGRYLAGGISVLVSGQALLNMLVVTSSVPATGVPLPFISYGGSSLMMNLLCVGILLSISKSPAPVRERR